MRGDGATIYYLTSLYCADDNGDAIFFFNMRARVSECVSLIIFIFWLYSVNDPILVHLWKKKKKKQLKNGKKMLRDL